MRPHLAGSEANRICLPLCIENQEHQASISSTYIQTLPRIRRVLFSTAKHFLSLAIQYINCCCKSQAGFECRSANWLEKVHTQSDQQFDLTASKYKRRNQGTSTPSLQSKPRRPMSNQASAILSPCLLEAMTTTRVQGLDLLAHLGLRCSIGLRGMQLPTPLLILSRTKSPRTNTDQTSVAEAPAC